jgi:hypothetical protein
VVTQSLHRDREVKDLVAEYGQVIVDECHHLSAFTFERVMRQCGPTRYSLGVRAMTDSTPFDHVVVPQLTDFRMPGDGADATIQDIYSALVTDEARNESIVRDVIHAVQSGRSPLVLTGRTDHLSRLESALTGKVRNIIVLREEWAESSAG